jgi:hypothetical protein
MNVATITQRILEPLTSFARRYSFPLTIAVAIILLTGTYQLGRASVYRAYPELSGVEQANAVIAKVKELIQLPTDESPTMATINDAASVKKTQPFLTPAENGDILLVYANAQEAILYRPSSNKLIAVGPVNNNAAPQAAAAAALPIATATTTTHATSSATSKK